MKSLLLLPVFLVGCANTDYTKYLDAQAEFARANPARPLLVIEAHEGQQITGLKRLEINTPQVGQGAANIQAPQPNQWLGIVGQALGIVGTVGGVVAGGKAAQGLARAVGDAATVGYSHVQAPTVVVPPTVTPQANVTNTLSGSGVMGGGVYSAPVTTTTLSGTGAIGGDYTHTPTDNHSINNSYNPATTYPVTGK